MKRLRTPSPRPGRAAPLNVHSLDHHGVEECKFEDCTESDTESSAAGSFSGEEVDDTGLGNFFQQVLGQPDAAPEEPPKLESEATQFRSEAEPETPAKSGADPQKPTKSEAEPREPDAGEPKTILTVYTEEGCDMAGADVDLLHNIVDRVRECGSILSYFLTSGSWLWICMGTEAQASRAAKRLHGIKVMKSKFTLVCQQTRPSDWPPGMAPAGERTEPAFGKIQASVHYPLCLFSVNEKVKRVKSKS